ncbi:MAG: hypothetical protein HQM10_02710 [Candidatus Riflebacteria bacterium]|nr:hypothetical protein [Candidatus Riflebacteria bacterium]
MKQVQPVSPKNPDYPGFRPRRRFLESISLFMRVEITLPICLLLTLSCASLNAQASSSLAHSSGIMVAQADQPPCLGKIAVPQPPPQTEEAPCSGIAMPPSEPQSQPAPCAGEPMPPSEPKPEPVPCTGEMVAPPESNPPCKGSSPAQWPEPKVEQPAAVRDLSLVDAVAKPGEYIGMRVRLQGFFGTWTNAGNSGVYICDDISQCNATQPVGMPLESNTTIFKNGDHCIVEGTIVQVEKSGSQKSSFAFKVEKFVNK